MGAQKYSILFITLTFILHNSEGMKCYVCNSAIDPDCGNITIPAKYLVTCSPKTAYPHPEVFLPTGNVEFTSCRKNVITVVEQTNGDVTQDAEKRIIRSCGYLKGSKDSSCVYAPGSSHPELMCQCATDACNAGHSLTFPWLTLTLFMGIATIFSQRRLFD